MLNLDSLDINDLEKGDFHIAKLDCNKCVNLVGFYTEIQKEFCFPNYFKFDLDSLSECLNDLDWIDKTNYCLVLENYNSFFIKRRLRH